nr:hypothetical protein [Mycoplasmopsis bovis]
MTDGSCNNRYKNVTSQRLPVNLNINIDEPNLNASDPINDNVSELSVF